MMSLKSATIAAILTCVVSSRHEEYDTERSLRKNANKDAAGSVNNNRTPNPSPSPEQTSFPTYSVTTPLLVDYLYTYGAPSTTLYTHQSNPNNECIPGIRTYTEDMTTATTTCEWYQFWCTEASGLRITNVDFASQINAGDGYMHPKMDTLILRTVDGITEYDYRRCNDGKYQHDFQWWPGADVPSDMLPEFNIHNLDNHYEARLMNVKSSVVGPMLSFASAARCTYADSVSQCLQNYRKENVNRIPGVVALGYELLAQMKHESNNFMTSTDLDGVIVLKSDQNPNYRKCIISFEGSDDISDLTNFVGRNNNPTSYCGRKGIHSGVKDELWEITHDSQYASIIKPALETCHEVSCVGHSLGGSLCNLFTMCANQGRENLEKMRYSDESMWDDYYSLVWTKMTSDNW